jgi:hypothetical protein
VSALRAKQADHIEELTALRPLYSEVVKLRSDNSALNRQVRSLQSSREAAQSDLNYMQSQYQTASTAAVARAREAEVAEAETAKLRILLDTGLKQRDAFARGEKRALELKVARLTSEVKLLRENDRRVQESGVRSKAAQWDNWCKMQEERWRRMESGSVTESDGDDDDEDDVEDENPEAKTRGHGEGDVRVEVAQAGPDSVMAPEITMPDTAAKVKTDQDDALVPPAFSAHQLPDSVAPTESQLSALSQPHPLQPQAFVCEWRTSDNGGGRCGAELDTRGVSLSPVPDAPTIGPRTRALTL